MSRQPWIIEEDQAIRTLVEQCGIEDWTKIAQRLKDMLGRERRTGKQCRQRWYNHLSPAVNKMPWTFQEEQELFMHHQHYGNRWKDISTFFIGRTDNDIKNHFYSTLRRSLRRLNKLVGEKNSTTQMRQIKPSVLSTIMNHIYSQEQTGGAILDLPMLIFEYAKVKPMKESLRDSNMQELKQKTQEIFNLINSLTNDYVNNKTLKKQKLKRQSKSKIDLFKQEIADQQQNLQQEASAPQEEERDDFQEDQEDHQEEKLSPYEKTMHEYEPDEIQEHHLHMFSLFSSPLMSPKQEHYALAPRAFSLQPDQEDLQMHEPEEPSLMQMVLQGEQQKDWMIDEEARVESMMDIVDEILETGLAN